MTVVQAEARLKIIKFFRYIKFLVLELFGHDCRKHFDILNFIRQKMKVLAFKICTFNTCSLVVDILSKAFCRAVNS